MEEETEIRRRRKRTIPMGRRTKKRNWRDGKEFLDDIREYVRNWKPKKKDHPREDDKEEAQFLILNIIDNFNQSQTKIFPPDDTYVLIIIFMIEDKPWKENEYEEAGISECIGDTIPDDL